MSMSDRKSTCINMTHQVLLFFPPIFITNFDKIAIQFHHIIIHSFHNPTNGYMFPFQHSKIQQLQQESHQPPSDLQSLQDFRQLLPLHKPIFTVNNYLIPQDGQIRFQKSEISCQEDEEEEGEKELMIKVMEQCHQIIRLKEELYYYRTQFFRLAAQPLPEKNDNSLQIKELQQKYHKIIQKLTQKSKQDTIHIQTLKKSLTQKDHQLSKLSSALQSQSTQQPQKPLQKDFLPDDKLLSELRYQSRVIMDLTAKNEKILKINSYLKQQLSIAEHKLVKIEMEQQQKTCGLLLTNLQKLKQNHNLINSRPSQNIEQWNTLPSQVRSSFKMSLHSNPLQKQQTVKLNSQRNYHNPYNQGRQSKTLEKEQIGLITNMGPKMRPLEDPKPQRKAWCGQIERYGRAQSRVSTYK